MSDPTVARYSGISFPPRKGEGYGFFHMDTDEELIKGNIRTILNTRKGSMPGVYDFGSDVHDMLFEPINDITQGLITDMIVKAINTWEPRVAIVQIKASSIDKTRIFEIVLKLKTTGQVFSDIISYSI